MRRFILIYIICACVAKGASAQVLSDFISAAHGGDTTAQFNAAQCYRYGWGTNADPTQWLHFMRLAAEGGEPQAQQLLAEHYRSFAPDIATYWAAGGTAATADYHYHSFDEGCYYGEMLGGVRDGYGSFAWDSGIYYIGEWENGERYGTGATRFEDQLLYGSLTSGQMEGFGAIVVTAEGCWLGGAEGSTRFVGYFERGVPNGIGTLYTSSGEVAYYGNFKNGLPTDPYPTTESYSLYRWEREELPNGDSWEGETYEGVRHGFGTYRWADGSWWCGFWHEGLREGEGLFVRSDGAMMTGTWENGELRVES